MAQDFSLRKFGLKAGMSIVFEKKTRCLYFQDDTGASRYIFDDGDNKLFVADFNAFLKIVEVLATVCGFTTSLTRDSASGVISYQFIEP